MSGKYDTPAEPPASSDDPMMSSDRAAPQPPALTLAEIESWMRNNMEKVVPAQPQPSRPGAENAAVGAGMLAIDGGSGSGQGVGGEQGELRDFTALARCRCVVWDCLNVGLSPPSCGLPVRETMRRSRSHCILPLPLPCGRRMPWHQSAAHARTDQVGGLVYSIEGIRGLDLHSDKRELEESIDFLASSRHGINSLQLS